MALDMVKETAISLRNTPYLVHKLLSTSLCVAVNCNQCFCCTKVEKWSYRAKSNVFLLQTDSTVKGKLRTQYCSIKKNIIWRLCAEDGAWRRGLQARRDDKVHQQSWHRRGRLSRLLKLREVNPNTASKWPWCISSYQFQCLCKAATRQPSTRGSTRPLGSQWSCSHLHPHTPRPHKPPSPYHIYRLDRALDSISDCWSRLCRPLYRNLYEKEQQLISVPRVALCQLIVGVTHYACHL